VVSLFADRGTATPRNALEYGNQKQRRKVYHRDVTHRAASYELARAVSPHAIGTSIELRQVCVSFVVSDLSKNKS
jgi:hypothetical protein